MELVRDEINRISDIMDQGKFLELTPPTVMLLNGLSHPEFSYCDIREVVQNVKHLSIIQENENGTDESNDILLLDFCKYCELESLKVNNVGIGVDLTFEEIYKHLKVLYLEDIVIQSVSLLLHIPEARWENLEELTIRKCHLSELEDIFNEVVFPNLRLLDVSENDIVKINDITERPLDAFIANDNKISSIHITSVPSISLLSLDNNYLTDINALKKLFNLREFSCRNNRISTTEQIEYVFRKMFSIQSIYLNDNEICKIDDYNVEVARLLPPFFYDSDRIEVPCTLDGNDFTRKELQEAKKRIPFSDYEEEQRKEEIEQDKIEDEEVEDITITSTVKPITDSKITEMYQSTALSSLSQSDLSSSTDSRSTIFLDKLISLDIDEKEGLSLSFDADLNSITFAPTVTDTSKNKDDDSRALKKIEMEKQTQRMQTVEYVQNTLEIINHPDRFDGRDVVNAERFLKKIKRLLAKFDNSKINDEVLEKVKKIPLKKDGVSVGDKISVNPKSKFTFDVDELTSIPYLKYQEMLTRFDNDSFVEVVFESERKKLVWDVVLPFEIPYGFEILSDLIQMYTKSDQDTSKNPLSINYSNIQACNPDFFDTVKQEEKKSYFW
ncbi:Leucine-rich repeat containing protein [Entamoeba marina]